MRPLVERLVLAILDVVEEGSPFLTIAIGPNSLTVDWGTEIDWRAEIDGRAE